LYLTSLLRYILYCMALNISLPAEPIFHLFNIPITNSIVTGWAISAIILIGAVVLRTTLKRVPKKFQNLIEMIYAGLLATTEKVIGRKDVARDIFPFIITAFFFITLSNWSGLLPGFGSFGLREGNIIIPFFRAPTADLNTVLAMALISAAYVQYLGVKYTGGKAYLGKFFNFSNPIYTFVGFIELVSEFTRIISYTFRLFGNVFAGEVLISVMFYLTYTLLPYVPILPLPFFFLELFVGVIQAFVFCFLTIVFTAMAIATHGDHAEEHTPVAVKPAVS
jgi:F-type H+-transporting ATPase subunit a